MGGAPETENFFNQTRARAGTGKSARQNELGVSGGSFNFDGIFANPGQPA